MGTYLYDISGVVGIASAFAISELADHEVASLETVDIEITRYTDGKPAGDRCGKYVWDERTNTITTDLGPGLRGQLWIGEDRIELSYTPTHFRRSKTLSVILWAVFETVRRNGGGMLYGAGVTLPDGGAALLFGPPRVGKTTTAALLARDWNCRLLADDKVLVDDGTVYSLRKPISVRRDSPLWDDAGRNGAVNSTARTAVRRAYTSLIPQPTRQLFDTVLSRLLDIDPETSLPASAVVPTAESAPLETALLLRPTSGQTEINRIDTDELVYRVTQTNRTDPGINHGMVTTYMYYSTKQDLVLTLGDEERIRSLLGDCAHYEICAPQAEMPRVVAENSSLLA